MTLPTESIGSIPRPPALLEVSNSVEKWPGNQGKQR